MTNRAMNTKLHKSKRLSIAAIATLLLGACTQIPELNEAVPNWVRRADYPKLTALDPSIETQILPREDSEEIEEEMAWRQNRLERKANQLKTTVVDDATQARMSDGITR
jgi:hypothetical protein